MAQDRQTAVTLKVRTPREIIERWFPHGKAGRITVDGELPGRLGEMCEVEVQIQEPQRTFRLQGRLSWARHKASAALRASYGVELVGNVDRLLALAREQFPSERSRMEDRLPVGLPGVMAHRWNTRKVNLSNLSSHGAFVITGDLLPQGSYLQLILRPPRSLRPLRLNAEVAWVKPGGATPGMGLHFISLGDRSSERLRKLIRRATPADGR